MNEHEAIWQDIEAVSNLNMDIDEDWRDVVGYEGYYQVSNLGRIRSIRRKGRPIARIVPPRPGNEYGHLSVQLSKESRTKTITVHKLVVLAWIGLKPVGKQIRHGPKGKLDNSVSNLCYGTASQDQLDRRRDNTHGGRAVKRSDGTEYISIAVAAEEMGCTLGNIHGACCGKQKTACGYIWEFIGPPREVHTSRMVRRSDGIEFESIGQAARLTNCQPANITRVCQGKRKTHHGYGWEYVKNEEERNTDAELSICHSGN